MKIVKKNIQKILEDIAREELGIESLEQKNNDVEDFKEVSVWGLRSALEAAYMLGLSSKKNK